jgi:hypothetical protein
LAHGQLAPPPAADKPAEKPAQPAPDPAPATRITPKEGEPTLIKFNDRGAMVRPEIPPEEAALDLVNLDAKEKAATDKLVDERGAAVDKVLGNNVPLLLKFLGVAKLDNRTEQLEAIKELAKVPEFTPLRDKVKYRDQLIAAMAPEKGVQYKQILSDYFSALSQQSKETQTFKGKAATPEQSRGFETLLAIGVEMRRSYDRQITAKGDKLGEMASKASLTPEQDAKIKAVIAEFQQKSAGKPTLEQQREAFTKVLKELNEGQRMTLLKELYGKA